MLRCVKVECSANCKVCFDYLPIWIPSDYQESLDDKPGTGWCVLSSSYACICDRFAYVSPTVCPMCVAMLRCVKVECSANCKVCFDYLVHV